MDGPVEGSTGPDRGATRVAGRSRRRWLSPLALLAGLVAVLSTLLLPVAPVSMAAPVVSWPQSATAPASTMLQLTAQTPLSLDVRFSCAAVRAAAGTDDGVVLSTVRPGQPTAAVQGLLVRSLPGGLTVEALGRTLVRDVAVTGDCSYAVTGDAAGLVLSRDGDRLARGPAGQLPRVDVLATSLTTLSPAEGEVLSAEIAVDDQFATTPSPLKWALIALVLLGAAGSVVFLVLEQRGDRPASVPGRRRFGVLDVVVPLVMVAWLFLAPMSDDDGYYAAMARNGADQGAVGNFYQLLNQNFTPFTWSYRMLGVWQQVGDSPAVLRVPALVTGLLTWFVLRRFTTQPGALPAVLQSSRRGRGAMVLVLAVAFLAWWLPYGMGVRPEAIGGFLAAVTLLGVASGLRRRSLPLLGLAVVAAALSAVCHPTGFVALAPLLAGLPRIVGVLREGVPARRAWLRGLAVVAPGSVAGIAAFGDGSLNDFSRGQEIFLSIQAQNNWFDEYQRYNFLFAPIAMGAYAKRLAVVLGIAALLWFAVVAATSRRRDVLSPQLLLAGQSLALAFLLLWITPSKWTHHFGALDGIGPAFLALFLVSVPVLVRTVPGGLRNGPLVGALAAGSAVLVVALSFHGPNDWAYSWLQGLPRPLRRPALGGVTLDNALLWALLVGVLVLAVRLLHRRLRLPRRRPWATAVPAAVTVALALSATYLVGGFAVAAVATADTYSPWADAIADPAGSTCGPAKAIVAADVDAARPLTRVPGAAPAVAVPEDAFAAGSGFLPASPPPTAPATEVWGSLRGEADGSAVGQLTTSWAQLPADPAEGEQLAVLVSGDLTEGGNQLTVEYGRTGATGVQPLGSAVLADDVTSQTWRTQVLPAPAGPSAGADAVRLVGADATTGISGWLAFTGPSVVPVVPLTEQLTGDAPVALAWQLAFLFPCQRQPDLSDGITEPVEHAVLWGDEGINGTEDATWQLPRGGLFAPTRYDSSVTFLGGTFPDFPEIDTVQVFRVVPAYPARGYDVRRSSVTRWGWQGPAEAAWPYETPEE
ncbi:arabinosyltransferase domain-containing protein [Modestobacter sp. VKM Ac-2986]|uniref:arabinosyltransferase domain-containing protein n=1 Tax=Modestobacter sp. VKM Ac-2986 TaxID=3004140 RepID=UPI0022AB4F22|nr:arabinosyltransferase domain-containing protein [Modestobacter sp. VKM Ac-2986]MCZ2829751.1 arabinosyltransferase domain-containing protein [Modestobacter sp. VKM Ac-2986]